MIEIKKVVVMIASSLVVLFVSLFFVNNVLLVDSQVGSQEFKEKDVSELKNVVNIGYLSGDISNVRLIPGTNDILLLNNNLIYKVSVETNNISYLQTNDFISCFEFISVDKILTASKENNEVLFGILDINTFEYNKLGYLSYRNFVSLSNVFVRDNDVQFSVIYDSEGERLSRDYSFRNGYIQRSSAPSSTGSLKPLLQNGWISVNAKDILYVSGAPFSYDGCFKYKYLGEDKSGFRYVLNEEDNEVLSLSFEEDIVVEEEIKYAGADIVRFLCTDRFYMITPEHIYDVSENIKYASPKDSNILSINSKEVIYEQNGEIFKAKF